ncbi:MAG: hypothetical protein ACUVUB_06885 [Candidatus Bathyarchaeia archaeon]
MSNLGNTSGQFLTDQKNDLLDGNGNPTVGESYLDIVEFSLAQEGSSYVGTMKVNGDIPDRIDNSSYFVEWEFMIDADKNFYTNPWAGNTITRNDIGIDHMVRLYVRGTSRATQSYDVSKHTATSINFQVNENELKLIFAPSDIGGSEAFDSIAMTRKSRLIPGSR